MPKLCYTDAMSEYHKPRITRYDMDALDFSTGTATFEDWEIGQYVSLLNHAWLDGHDCTLPQDIADLRAIARSSHDISDKVLKKFRLNSEKRLYNERLLEEWNKALARSSAAQDKANRRHHPDAVAMPKQCKGNAKAMPISVSVSVSDSVVKDSAAAIEGDKFQLKVEEENG
jgi:uncharacterized protein YdaU (DUF1376 family)